MIEINPEHRAKLVELAARRGEKGFSSVIGEAIEAYLLNNKTKNVSTLAHQLRGSLSDKDADELRRETTAIRADVAAERTADVRLNLDKRGLGIGLADTLIAGIVLGRDGLLLTRNRKHFERVPGLRLAD